MPTTDTLEITQEQKIENFVNEGVKGYVPHSGEKPIPEPEPVVENTIIEPEPAVEKPIQTDQPKEPVAEIPNEAPEITFEGEPEHVTDIDWNAVSQKTGIKGSNETEIAAALKEKDEKLAKYQAQIDQYESLATVSQTVQVYDSLLSLDPETLIRRKLKEVDGWSDDDVEAEIEDLTESGRLNSVYRTIKAEINNLKNSTINNAVAIRKQKEQEQANKTQEFQSSVKQSIKSFKGIYGHKFNEKDLNEVHGRAERLASSKEFMAKLQNPEYVAELACWEVSKGSVVKMLENRAANKAKNDILSDFKNPTPRTPAAVERPDHLTEKKTWEERTKAFLDSAESGGISRG